MSTLTPTYAHSSEKFGVAKALGATDCINPNDLDKPIQEVLVDMTTWGVDYTLDCTGQSRLRCDAACWRDAEEPIHCMSLNCIYFSREY